jgi:hypothetical protein
MVYRRAYGYGAMSYPRKRVSSIHRVDSHPTSRVRGGYPRPRIRGESGEGTGICGEGFYRAQAWLADSTY